MYSFGIVSNTLDLNQETCFTIGFSTILKRRIWRPTTASRVAGRASSTSKKDSNTDSICRKSIQGILKRGKYHCTIDLLFDWFGSVCFANKNKKLSVVIQLIPNQSNRRSMVQCYFPPLVFPGLFMDRL